MKKLETIIELLSSDKTMYSGLKYFGFMMLISGLFNVGLLLLSVCCFAGMAIIGNPSKK